VCVNVSDRLGTAVAGGIIKCCHTLWGPHTISHTVSHTIRSRVRLLLLLLLLLLVVVVMVRLPWQL
jgi:preprotein translocase subunit SecF